MRRAGRAHRLIELLLRSGLIVSVILMIVGFVMALVTGQHAAPSVRLGHLFGEGSSADRVMTVGVLVLILTPVARVGALVLIWIRQRDWRFVVVGAVVLALLTAAILLGTG